jgi:hypothetical protein
LGSAYRMHGEKRNAYRVVVGRLEERDSSTNIIRMMKSRRRWARHVVRMGEKRNVYRIFMVCILLCIYSTMVYQRSVYTTTFKTQ